MAKAKDAELITADAAVIGRSVQQLFGTDSLQIDKSDVSDIFISDFITVNLLRQAEVKDLYAQKVKEAEEAETAAEEIMVADAQERAVRFQAEQNKALKVWEINLDEVRYTVRAEVVIPDRGKGKAKNGPVPYEFYVANITTEAGNAVQNWSGSFTVGRQFKLTAKAIKLLQVRDEARAAAAEARNMLDQLKMEEASGPERLRLLVNGQVAKIRIESAEGGSQLLQLVTDKAMQTPALKLTYGGGR